MSRRSIDGTDGTAASVAQLEPVEEETIVLEDHTTRPEDIIEDQAPDLSHIGTETPVSPTKSLEPVSPRRTRTSIKGEIARRKWAKYQENPASGSRRLSRSGTISSESEAPHTPTVEETAEAAARWGESSLQTARRKAREVKDAALGRRPTLKEPTDDIAVVDILYENQRGWFFFGIPLFSSRSLLNLDPSPWLNGEFKPSAVDITDAQVPDPSWSWEWRTWYVDMCRDVDEEGWEYSFSFQKKFSWHGNHPWFHSFVRRRRWLRKRTRGRHHIAQDQAHALNLDYFTIHTSRTKSPNGSYTESHNRRSMQANTTWGARASTEDEPIVDLKSIASLMKGLRSAVIDREKILLLTNFINDGGEELTYLTDQMPTIMDLLVFQTSQQQLLSLLIHSCQEAKEKAESTTDDSAPSRRYRSLLRAIQTSEQHCRQLEYWSDARDVYDEGKSLGLIDPDKDDSDSDKSDITETADTPIILNKGKQRATEPFPDLDTSLNIENSATTASFSTPQGDGDGEDDSSKDLETPSFKDAPEEQSQIDEDDDREDPSLPGHFPLASLEGDMAFPPPPPATSSSPKS